MPRLGFLLLLSIAACGHPAPDHAPPPPPGSRAGAIAAPAVPSVAVPFRWSAGPLPCETQLAVRAATATCARDGVEVEVRLGGTQLSIARVDRAQVAGHTRWSVEVALAAPATDPVVATIPQDGVVVAAATGADAIELAFVDLATGALRGRARVPVTATGPVQLERRHDGEPLRVHARTAGGGATALVDATTAAVLGVATTPAAAIRTRMDPAAVAADGVARAVAGGDAITAGWDDALVVRRRAGADDDAAPRWETTLIAGSGPFRSELVTLHVAGDLVVGTVHHPSASWTQVFAIDAADGAVRWRRTVTGIGPIAHSAYANHVASRVDGDLLVVQGVESGGTYVCTIDLATGAERACVDHLAAADVVAPAAPAHVPPPRLRRPGRWGRRSATRRARRRRRRARRCRCGARARSTSSA
ncbi:MAG: hypothetical protein H6708_16325 [Kofleriaceae bacterium]|nr:hypothetical protein [Kofleriaceae bacterium]